ncbi:MAG: HAD-IIIC family phosphatase [Thermoanaerobaculia bacterium]|jgi:FkbH-like protein|nr:HAD-IIIC family phosphatase [Thermoanaerobaculia bacterium]MBP9825038.1 HAD-IIIC family phosphatase [Thermoanaerobaculia bacterium]
METDSLSSARRALEAGESGAAFDTVRRLLAEATWTAVLVKSAGDLLAHLSADTAGAAIAVERVAVIGGCTTGLLLPALRCALAEEGRLAVVYEGPFGAYRQEILDPTSGLHRFGPQTVLLVRSWRELMPRMPLPTATSAQVQSVVDAEVAELEGLWSTLIERHRCRILQHAFELPDLSYIGAAENAHAASGPGFVASLDRRLRESSGGRVAWVETGAAAQRAGSERWCPADLYHLAKLPLHPSQLGSYARLVQGAFRVAANRTRKVLVTDLDNTLWGGVIGDDGLSGVALGPGSPAGEGFESFARYLLGLKQRGVILAVCSKNDPAIAAQPFREHPHMPLREADFAVFHCSWDDKASGLRRISAELNLGLDSFVLVDDNPAECALVRRELPEVATVHLQGSASLFPYQVEARHLFDRDTFTAEDIARAEMYRSRSDAERLRSSSTDLESFLADLRMEGHLSLAQPVDLERLAQLEAKTNQFNTTTARFQRADLERFLASPTHALFAFRLRDRFVDHGLVSCVIAEYAGDRLVLLNWTMSCRVFSRGAEEFIRNRLLEHCQERNLSGISAAFHPTQKNEVIADLFPRLGFLREGESRWQLAGAAPPLPSRIEDSGGPGGE